MAELSKLYDAIVAGKLEPAVEVTKEAIAEGVEPQVIIKMEKHLSLNCLWLDVQ